MHLSSRRDLEVITLATKCSSYYGAQSENEAAWCEVVSTLESRQLCITTQKHMYLNKLHLTSFTVQNASLSFQAAEVGNLNQGINSFFILFAVR